MDSIVVAAAFVVLALAHSVLGERELLRPLFAQRWELPIPRAAVERILRFAWHLTSVAWLGLASLAFGASLWAVLGVVAGASAVIVFVTLRGHLAWPLFALAAFGAGLAGGYVGDGMLMVLGSLAALALAAVGLLHVAWAAGWGADLMAVAVPSDAQGRPRFEPPRVLTLAVALGLLGAAAVVGVHVLGWDVYGATAVAGLLAVVFGLRAVGDFRTVGFTKPGHATTFEQLDDAVYTPLSVLFAFGSAAALLL